MLSSGSDKGKFFAKNFSRNSNFDDWDISLLVFPSATNLKLHNCYVTRRLVKKAISSFDLSKSSSPEWISVVLLKNCEPELSYILAELFNMYLSKSCFSGCWKVWSAVPVFKNVWGRSTAKNYSPVTLLSVVNKVFERLVNNKIVDHLEKCGLFTDFQYGFRSSRLTENLLTGVSEGIARTGATQTVAFDMTKVFNGVWHACLLHKLRSYGISGQIFGLISSFLINRRLQLIVDGKFSWEYPVNAEVSQDFFSATY